MPEVFIYKITHIASGKVYIGQTVYPEQRWKKHGINNKKTRISKAIMQFGKEAFRFEILESVSSREEAFQKEIEYVGIYESNNPDKGYNMTEGGRKGYKEIRGEEHHSFGVKRPYMSELNKKKKGIKVGDMHSQEFKEKVSLLRKKEWESGVHTMDAFLKRTRLGRQKWQETNIKRVICNETGIVYSSATDAAIQLGNKNKVGSILRQIKGKQKIAYGLTFSHI